MLLNSSRDTFTDLSKCYEIVFSLTKLTNNLVSASLAFRAYYSLIVTSVKLDFIDRI